MTERKLLKKLIVNKSSNLIVQLFRYVMTGGVAFVADFGLLYFLTEEVGVHYLVSTIAAYSLGLMITYCLSIFWIFDKRSSKNWLIELAIFATIGLIGLGLTYLIMWLLTDMLHLHYLLSKIVSTGVVFIWNFVTKKLLLFSK